MYERRMEGNIKNCNKIKENRASLIIIIIISIIISIIIITQPVLGYLGGRVGGRWVNNSRYEKPIKKGH
jgi:hypothetical protein